MWGTGKTWGFSLQAEFPAALSLGRATLLRPFRMKQEAQRGHLDMDRLLVAGGPARLPPASFGPSVPLMCPFSPPPGHDQGRDMRALGVTSSATPPSLRPYPHGGWGKVRPPCRKA